MLVVNGSKCCRNGARGNSCIMFIGKVLVDPIELGGVKTMALEGMGTLDGRPDS